MATPKAPPPPPATAPKATASQAATLGRLTPRFEPPRIIINAVEGWGKTSIASHGENAAVLMARGETGYQTLLGAGRVPSVDAAAIDSWPQMLATVEGLSGYGTLILDALGGFERLCHEHVCDRDFKGDWGEKGFASFAKGYDVSVTDWLRLLSSLDRLRSQGTAIVFLSHCKVTTFKNPMGADFDRYASDCHHKTWSATAKWADAVMFGNFESHVELNRVTGNIAKDKGKGIGGTQRVVYTERRDAFDAKNRYGMPPELTLSDDAAENWTTIWHHIKGGN